MLKIWDYDRMYIQRIRNGDIAGVLEKRQAPESCGARECPAAFKHYEYQVCAAITLAAHAAIEGGLDPASAYDMKGLYLQRLEICKDIPEMQQLHDEIELAFAQLVHVIHQERSNATYVEKCKLFIDQHLHMPFTLDDISDALNINKSYLSRRFAQDAGMRIMEYTRQKRIEAAANMLKYSDKTISAISANFCFSTQSHFGNLFKQMMGMTPLKYRAANQVIEMPGGE
ncbi:MAG: AraC family transcriptional regulator [Defluviitaleaceae bacterium]|nr:AraC family transcriptional regulator [Defluviitaleaceae bacterium]